MKKIISVICAAVLCLSLCSCSVIYGMFGISSDYRTEPAIAYPEADGETAAALADMISMLTLGSPELPEFKDVVSAMDKCRDSVLFYMLGHNYGKYTGDLKRLDEASEKYPQMTVTNLIPAVEFEATVYKYFGGFRKISNASGQLFVYLDRISAYTAVTVPDVGQVDVNITSLVETEHTYRFNVTCSLGDVTSDEYSVIVVKREDGSMYFDRVTLPEE